MTGASPHTPALSSRLAELNALVAERLGLHYPPERWSDLQRGFEAAAKEFGYEDAERCLDWLLGARLEAPHIALLARHLTVGETYFLREPRTFDLLAQRILPELVLARRGGEQRLRLWSAGCCTGEEAYTLAILLHQLLPDRPRWQVDILATDINPQFLRAAEEGVYRSWSFRGFPADWRDHYFRPVPPDGFEIRQNLRRLVTFSSLNLATDTYPSLLNDTNAMDIILCRNVLMYFTPEQAAKVVRQLHHCLVDGGWLLVGASDLPSSFFADFAPAVSPDLPAYQKRAAPPLADGAADAGALYEQGRYSEATARLAAHEPSVPEMALLARALANQGRLAEARFWSDRLVAARKLDPSALYLRAAIRLEQGSTEAAARDYRRALMLDPGFVLAHVALGHLDLKQGDAAGAASHYEAAQSLLQQLPPETPLPESDGLTAARMREMLTSLLGKEASHAG